MESKDLIAVYAAILSTAVFVWNIFNTVRDKGRIKIGGFFGHSVGGLRETNIKILYFEFVNVGSKPIYLTTFGGQFKRKYIERGNKAFIINTPGLPVKLDPGQRHQVTFESFESVDHRVKKMFVNDTTGIKYKMKRKLLKSLIEQKKSFSTI